MITLLTSHATPMPTSPPAIRPSVGPLLEPELPGLAEEIVAEVCRSVAEYEHLPVGDGRTGLRHCVEMVLRQFAEQMDNPLGVRERTAAVSRNIGRNEFREGRSLDALQAAYRVGALVAWRRFALIGTTARLTSDTMCRLAEAVMGFSNKVATYSVQGYEQARGNHPGSLQQYQRRLLKLLLTDPSMARSGQFAELAARAGWTIPKTVVCVALDAPWQGGTRVRPSMGLDVLVDLEDPEPHLLIPGRYRPHHIRGLEQACQDTVFAFGPAVPLEQAPMSLSLARRGLRLMRSGVIAHAAYLDCAEHLTELLLDNNRRLIELIGDQCYGRMADVKDSQRRRLQETLLAWLTTGENSPELARRLHVHPQTVRYRMRQLEAIFGPLLQDPVWRFNMQIVLHADQLGGRPLKR